MVGATDDVVQLGDLFADVENWRASEMEDISFEDGALTMVPGAANRTTAGYYGETFQNEWVEVYFTPEDLSANGVWPGIALRTSNPTEYFWVGAGNNAYAFLVKEDIFELQAWTNGSRHFLLEFPNEVVVSGETSLWQAQALNTDDGVLLTLKIDGEVVIEYLDKQNYIPGAGYVTLLSPGTAVTFSGAAECEAIQIADLIADQENWRASEADKVSFGDGSITLTPGADNRTAAGYYGETYLNEAFEVYFTAENLEADGVWPGFVLRSSNPTTYSWLGNDGYLFVVKSDIFELQGWVGNGRRFLETYPNEVIKSGETNLLRVQAQNTDEGVLVTFMVNGDVVAEHLDRGNTVSGAGYLGLVAPGTVVTYSGK